MKSIWKYPLKVTDTQEIFMPKGAQILCVQMQFDEPCVWAMVDINAQHEPRLFEMFGTGHPIHEDMGVSRNYIGTFQIADKGLVFHLFEYTGV